VNLSAAGGDAGEHAAAQAVIVHANSSIAQRARMSVPLSRQRGTPLNRA
jgi:hypothetical protein